MITLLLGQCHGLKFLLTSRVWVGVLQDIEEKIIELKELAPHYAVDLFLSRARPIKDDEKRELIKYTPDDMLLIGDANQQNIN